MEIVMDVISNFTAYAVVCNDAHLVCLIQNTWNENLLQIKATRKGNLVTSVGSGLLSLWRPTHGRFLYHLQGQSHSTSCLAVVGEQLLSAASNGNIVIHSGFESSVSTLFRLSVHSTCMSVCH